MIDYITNQLLVRAILLLLALSTLISLLDFLGFLPRFLSEWIHRNRASDTVKTLQILGFDLPGVKRRNAIEKIPALYAAKDVKEYAKTIVDKFHIKGAKKVGSVNSVHSPGFIDIMGAATSPQTAEMVAKLLASFWRTQAEKPNETGSASIDFVVAPKTGSPTIAYEFARLLSKPLVLHNAQKKFESENSEISSVFDSSAPLNEGMIGIIVDDSTTGGAKMLSLISDLKRYGLICTDALVLFEPELKDPRLSLGAKGVKLHSIVRFTKQGTLV